MRFRNISDKPCFYNDGILKINVAPGAEIEFPEGQENYCLPRKGEAPTTMLPSIVESLCPQLKPVNPDEGIKKVEAKAKAIKTELKKPVPDLDTLIKSGMAPAVARAKVAAAQAATDDDEDEKDND